MSQLLLGGRHLNRKSEVPDSTSQSKGRLPRLTPEHYRGRAFVHWSMAIDGRKTGWLDAEHHAVVRELLCHALARYRVMCPAYCLMPDHAHFLWIGAADTSDQRCAAALFRKTWNAELVRKNQKLQLQAHDHVLRESERAREAFASVAHYIFENPVRADIVEDWRDYQYLGCLVPGYPVLNPREDGFWPRFWRIHARLTGD